MEENKVLPACITYENWRESGQEFFHSMRAKIISPDISELTFVASKVNYKGQQCYPVALLRSVLHNNNIEQELITVIEYFRKLAS